MWAYSNPNRHRDANGNTNANGNGGAEGYAHTAAASNAGTALVAPARIADAKKLLPINVDGAIGTILAELGMHPGAFNGIFMIARTPGLIAHVIEEQARKRPMRRIDPVNHGYDGPAPSSISDKSSS